VVRQVAALDLAELLAPIIVARFTEHWGASLLADLGEHFIETLLVLADRVLLILQLLGGHRPHGSLLI
jgi:hypothetical protein